MTASRYWTVQRPAWRARRRTHFEWVDLSTMRAVKKPRRTVFGRLSAVLVHVRAAIEIEDHARFLGLFG